MTPRLADRLSQSRRQRFVGRGAELELFRAALGSKTPEFPVLHIFGPGGMGKTTLLREFARLAEESRRPHIFLDCRHVEPSPTGFLTSLHLALRLPLNADPLAALSATPNFVILLDTYELAAPLDDWLREEFLPQLSQETIVVFAGRQPPPAAWRADDGWGALARIVSLRNLRPEESAAFLSTQGLPEEDIQGVLDVTYGHPLALSLAADLFRQNASGQSFHLQKNPDILRLLLERFVAEVTNPIYRQALEVCAHAFATDEGMLAQCLGEENAYAAFQWLRGLSFIEQGPFGLFPHDLAREVLEADLRWRNLPRFRELHFQVRGEIIQRILRSDGPAQQFAIFALLFLHRNNPFMRPFYEWQTMGQLYIDQARPEDMPDIEAIILRHQGQESLGVARYWRSRPNASFFVFRGAGQTIAGFSFLVDISQMRAADMEADPAMRAATEHLRSVGLPRQGATILYFRNWMDAEHGQRSPSIFNMAAMIALRYYFNTPSLAYSFIAQMADDRYVGMYEYLRTPLTPQAGFVIDGQPCHVFVRDWQAEPVLAWMEIMGERELLDEIVALEALPQTSQTVALSEPEFAEAVRQALRDLRRPDLLAQNPLLRSRCLRQKSEGEATVELLQTTLQEGASLLTGNPRSQKLHRVLWHTFFEPAATQEAAAELLDLPFSTYRYQLGKAVEQIVGWLWQQEVYGNEQKERTAR